MLFKKNIFLLILQVLSSQIVLSQISNKVYNSKGSEKTVYSCEYNGSKACLLEYKNLLEKKYLNEKFILQNFSHPNIITLIDFNDNNLTLIEEHGELSLANLIEAICEAQFIDIDPISFLKFKLKILIDIITGILFLHNKNYIHKDLKPENVILFGVKKLADEKFKLNNPEDFVTAKLIDFSFTKQRDKKSIFCGSLAYTSYRQFLEDCGASFIDDIWAFAVIGYELINEVNIGEILEQIFKSENKPMETRNDFKNNMKELIFSGWIPPKIPTETDNEIVIKYTNKLNDLFEKCWSRNDKKIPTTEYILNKLNNYLNKLKSINSNLTEYFAPNEFEDLPDLSESLIKSSSEEN
ncbi:MAG: hypothetical protein SZ59_C0002G0237 [candidate division TM6 bacterium GW2011_GWF2_28_16]|nr:MAG: hypothetical protein SZ59_C0002G0237 [candidate division TM6 bacterium GW2011_GWF2_28_16]